MTDKTKNKIISFNKGWNTSEIIKEKILVINNLYTNLLEYILEEDENINVIFDKDKNICTVYINGNYISMEKNIILKETMKKLNEHLLNFLEEKKNILNNQILNIILDTINQKYKKYLEDVQIQKNVDDLISDIYEKKREKAQKNFNLYKN
jgi:hypothetical protein